MMSAGTRDRRKNFQYYYAYVDRALCVTTKNANACYFRACVVIFLS